MRRDASQGRKSNAGGGEIKSNATQLHTPLKKLQNYSPRRGTVIVEAFSLRKRNSGRYTTRQQFQKKNLERVWVRDWGRTALWNGVVGRRCQTAL